MTEKTNHTFYLSAKARAYLERASKAGRRSMSDWLSCHLEDLADTDTASADPGAADTDTERVTAAAA